MTVRRIAYDSREFWTLWAPYASASLLRQRMPLESGGLSVPGWQHAIDRNKVRFPDLPWHHARRGVSPPIPDDWPSVVYEDEVAGPPIVDVSVPGQPAPSCPMPPMFLPDDSLHVAYTKPATDLMFALIGDTHASSNEEKLDELNAFYDICVREGITDVYHTGDMDCGEDTYPGQRYEVKHVGFAAHMAYAEANYPKRDGITTHVIGGNHDFTWHKRLGIDFGEQLSSKREDIHYLGKMGAYVELAPGCMMYLLHPDGGVTYALSYKRQRIVEGFLGGTKPHLFASGHDHQAMHFRYRNTEIFGTGCFEGQTLFLKRKGIQPQIGGWIVELRLDDTGTIRRCKAEFVCFYENR